MDRLAEDAAEDAAEAVILGCTEIGMLLLPDDVEMPASTKASEARGRPDRHPGGVSRW